jgi:hypothetical protein
MLKSANIVDAIKELGQQIAEQARVLDDCPIIQVHILPTKEWRELKDACEGKVPFTFYHLELYYQSYSRKHPDCEGCSKYESCERAR